MKAQTLSLTAIAAITALGVSLGLAPAAKADTVMARCDFYNGEGYPSFSVPCTFSQRQGNIYIQRSDGATYDLRPVGQPDTFIDQNGIVIYRRWGLGDAGQIFQFPGERLYLYWDAAPSSNQSSPPYSNNALATLRGRGPDAQINVRSEPTLYSRAFAYGLNGDQVEILNCVEDTDVAGSNLSWCQVEFPVSGTVGWVRSDLIIFPGEGL